jgi:hypothetical protein
LPPSDPLLLAALRAAPRPYLLPPLPHDAEAARAQGVDASLAFAIDAARSAQERGVAPAAEAKALFLDALARFIADALAPDTGDPAYQALLLQTQEPQVREFVQLSSFEAADRRAVRSALDAVAHPGKLRGHAEGSSRDALAIVHTLSRQGDWAALHDALQQLPAGAAAQELRALAAHPALQRLLRQDALARSAAVQRYVALCERRGPLAGSAAASQQGRASAHAGDEAERLTVEALRRVAALLDAHDASRGPHRVVRSLRPPRGFPGPAAKAKDEWDAAILRGNDIVLLAEVKASPAAAASDFPRLVRGLERLAHASEDETYAFASADGEVRVSGASLRALGPSARVLPLHVIYCCPAPAEAQPAILGAATKSVLGGEPASLAFAQRLARGESPSAQELAPVWDALAHSPRLRAALHQYDTAQAARAAMLQPRDLLDAVALAVQARK